MHHQDQPTVHVPVLLEAVLQYLQPQRGESYLDVTAGYGGHARAILERTDRPSAAVLVDRDTHAYEVLSSTFARTGAEIRNTDFFQASSDLMQQGRRFDIVLADLGVSSPHLNETNRGFTFTEEGPLDMRMDQRQKLTAYDVVNRYTVDQLTDILHAYGEEPKARRIAQLIVDAWPVTTTSELAHIAMRAWPGHSRVHPATRTFQAIRIAVNGELELLEKSLPIWLDLLNPGGRIGIISFHSLEDRLVKRAFSELAGDTYDAQLQILTKHPVAASNAELVFNPRARSAKFRAAAKIKK